MQNFFQNYSILILVLYDQILNTQCHIRLLSQKKKRKKERKYVRLFHLNKKNFFFLGGGLE